MKLDSTKIQLRMTTHHEILSVLDLGWESSRRAWKLLAPEHRESFNLQQIGTTGRDLDQLAFELRRLGLNKPARLAYSVAFVLNAFASETIPFNHDLADKTSQIVSIMAEMLLELESTREVTAEEPAEIVEHLTVDWGMVLYAETPSSKLPNPHFRSFQNGRKRPSEQVLTGLVHESEQLVDATESLMLRIQNISDFPYSPSLSRVQHLATLVRDRVLGLALPDGQPNDQVGVAASASSSESRSLTESAFTTEKSIGNLAVAEEPIRISNSNGKLEESDNSIPFQRRHEPIAPVLVIDESPFFRMLFTSAVEACGYSIHTVATLDEAMSTDQLSWSIVVFSGDANHQNIAALRGWLSMSVAKTAKIVILTSENPEALIPDGIQIRRSDIAGLMSIMKKELGDARQESRMSA